MQQKTNQSRAGPGSRVLAAMAVTQIAGPGPAWSVFARVRREVRWHHSALLVDCFGDRLGTTEVVNRVGAFPDWLTALQAMAPGKRLIFGLENTITWGRALAGYLLAQGQTVRDVAPIRTARRRKRHPHPDKSDERDALAIARALMQDLGELPATVHDDLVWTLSLTGNQREGLVREQTRVKNRLHALLQ